MRTVYCPMCGCVVGLGPGSEPGPELCDACSVDLFEEVEDVEKSE